MLPRSLPLLLVRLSEVTSSNSSSEYIALEIHGSVGTDEAVVITATSSRLFTLPRSSPTLRDSCSCVRPVRSTVGA